jgi:ABC-type polysaccharide/polyol phosphate export permease
VIYPLTVLPHQLQHVERFNPIYQFVNVFRSMLYGDSAGSWHAYVAMLLSTAVALTSGVVMTRRTRRFVLGVL